MSNRIHYWLPDHGMSADDAYVCDSEAFDLAEAAEEAALDYHSNHDGWDSSWPLIICLKQGDDEGRFEVERESRAHFTAYERPVDTSNTSAEGQ